MPPAGLLPPSPMNALILVDLQNDFLPGGALAVPRGDEVIALANALEKKFELVVATKDWHPADHVSFAATHPGKKPGEIVALETGEQVLWPVHCVRQTAGAELAPGLNKHPIRRVFAKAVDSKLDCYSGFYDVGRRSTGLAEYLRERGVGEVYILGLATDYCVKATALDAVQLGFKSWVIEDACRPVNLQPGDSERAIAEMRAAGVNIIQSSAL
jgi:nicotinamidase/pyrazinamidase